MKKIFFLLLVSGFGILFTACGKSPQNVGEFSRKMDLKIVFADLDKSGQQEKYELSNGRLSVTVYDGEPVEGADFDAGGQIQSRQVWQSPVDWWVGNFVLADSTGDGVTDLNMSVWKSGNYGSSKPFWVKKNDMRVRNHFFVFDFKDGVMKPLWQSSNLPAPNCEFAFGDVDGDGKQNLVVLEGDYSDDVMADEGNAAGDGFSHARACQGHYVAAWQWDEWGFVNVSRGKKGNYKNLRVEKVGGVEKVLVDGAEY